jgi:hypothetical protein
MHTDRRRLRPAALLSLAFVAALAGGCATASGPSPAGSATAPSAAPSVAPSSAPSVDPNGSVGMDLPTDDPSGVPDPGGKIVVPKPGQLDVHPVAAGSLAATVDGRRVVVTVTYTSGVEPCYVLDSIVVQRGDHAIAITLREGHGPGDAVCIEIAETKRTMIDLGELDPGTWTITDTQGGAPPITVTIA